MKSQVIKYWIAACGLALVPAVQAAKTHSEKVQSTKVQPIKVQSAFHGWYGGVDLASNQYDLSPAKLNAYAYMLDTPAETRVDRDTVGYSIFGGYRINQFIAIETGYVDLGTASYHLSARTVNPAYACPVTPSSCPAPIRYAASDYDYQAKGMLVRAKPSFPIGTRWLVEARAGLALLTYYTADQLNDRQSFHDASIIFGIDGSFAVTPHLILDLHWDRFSGGPGPYGDRYPISGASSYQESVNSDSIGVGIKYRW